MHYKILIDGQWKETGDTKIIVSPFSGKTIGICEYANKNEIEEAIESAKTNFPKFKKVSRYARSILLKKIANGIEQRKAEFINCIVEEAGKPISLAEVEVARAINSCIIASEEAKRYGGDFLPIDSEESGRNFEPAMSFFTPRGVILAISPFNFPVNLVVHKLAPALAIGASLILKPSPEAPGASCLLGEIFLEATKFISETIENIPVSSFQIIHCSNELSSEMVKDKRISVISFTGSDRVGWSLQSIATRKKVCLELGGNAAVIIYKDADIMRAVKRCVFGSFSYAGQICISVQRIFIQKEKYPEFKKIFLSETENIIVGDPTEKETLVGPLINRGARDRILSWVEQAQKDGAILLNAINASENILYPIVLESVPSGAKVFSEEVFGPVVIIDSFDEISEAIQKVNDSRFGLQVGVFTDSDSIMSKAINELEAGAILFNEIPTFRADHLPYGGVKDSGLGREGIRFAMEEFSERKTVIKWRNANAK